MNGPKINFIIHIKEVIPQMAADPRLKTVDIFLYISLFLIWNKAQFKNPLSVSRWDIQGVKKVSDDCYSPSLTRLHNAGYIIYTKGKNGIRPAIITMRQVESITHNFQSPLLNSQLHLPDSPDVAILQKGNLNKHELNNKQKEEEGFLKNNAEENFQKQNAPIPKNGINLNAPDSIVVRQYFEMRGSTTEEADKFYKWNNDRNWRLSRESQDWRWHADNWIKNSFKKRKQKSSSTYELNSRTDQEYNEPL